MELVVCNRREIEGLEPQAVPHLVISITTVHTDQAQLPEDPQRRGALRLSFPDIEEPPLWGEDLGLFSKDQARQIWKFVMDRPPEVTRLIVHCDAGLSRSPAVAAAVSEVLYGDARSIFDRYFPNRRVYSLLMEVYTREFRL